MKAKITWTEGKIRVPDFQDIEIAGHAAKLESEGSRMKWIEPGLIELTEEQKQILNLAITAEEVWAEVGGLDGIIKDACDKCGGTYRLIDLEQEVD